MVESFDDGDALLTARELHKLDGLVSKLRHVPYQPGSHCG
jgi:ATP-dependent DNA ligase